MKKAALVIVSLVLLVSVLPMSISCTSDDVVKWTVATYSFPDVTRTKILENFAAKVEEKSGGDMEIRVATTGELYETTGIFDAVSGGSIELGLAPPVTYMAQMPKYVNVLSQAWGDNFTDRIRYWDAILEGSEAVKAELAGRSITPLFYVSTGFLEFYFEDAVTTVAGTAGKQLYSAGGAVDGLVEALGSTPHNMPHTDIHTSIASNLINGMAVHPFDDYYNNKTYEELGYALMTRALEYGFHVLMNSDAFDDLDEDLQDIVLQAAEEAEEEGFASVTADFEAAYDDIVDNGLATVTEITATEKADLQAIIDEEFGAGFFNPNWFTAEQRNAIMAIKATVAAEIAAES